jgi:F-type H+-transporting ATPase subunit b
MRLLISASAAACERTRKLTAGAALLIALIAAGAAFPGAPAVEPAVRAAEAAAADHTAATHEQPAAPEQQGEEHGSGGGIVSALARIVNFAILAGTLIYVLRSPLLNYLRDRSSQIRHDLVTAAQLKEAAATQIEEINRRMEALPGELETLRAQGAQETAAEEARILAAAASERDRLLDQARREIDLQVRLAERELVTYTADLAIGAASERIRHSMTDDDQKRLVDRYVAQLKR